MTSTTHNRHLLVCLHPIGLNASMWSQFVPQLHEKHTIVALNLPGHGGAAALASEWSIAAMADAVMENLRAFRSDFALLGASLGGMVAQELSLRNIENVKLLILADTLSAVTPAQRSAIRERATKARDFGMPALLEDTMARWFTPSFIEQKADQVAQVKAILADCDPQIHALCWEAIADFNVSDKLSEIRVPVCTIVGSEDVSTPPHIARSIADGVPDGRCRIVPSAGHMSMIEKPEDFTSIVSDFIEEHCNHGR